MKLCFFEHRTGRAGGLVVTKPDSAFRMPSAGQCGSHDFTLAISRESSRLGQPA